MSGHPIQTPPSAIHVIPVLQDNYAYLLEGEGGLLCVDPGEAGPVVQAAQRLGQPITAILNTHRHWDHVDGNREIKKAFGCRIYGPNGEIPERDEILEPGETRSLEGIEWTAMATPGHLDHDITFWIPAWEAAFCADCLMTGGCGRVCTGDLALMWESLQRIAELPPQTRLYSGHHYAPENYAFACAQSQDPVYRSRLQWAKSTPITVPSTVEEELRSNIFLRAETFERFAELRKKKDAFPE